MTNPPTPPSDGESRALAPINLTAIVREIHAQREEICRAFIAKYGFEPDEVEQVTGPTPDGQSYRWFVRKRYLAALRGEKAGER